jgi:hypothetical protein
MVQFQVALGNTFYGDPVLGGVEEHLLIRVPQLLHDIGYECPNPMAFNNDSIMDHIEKVYQLNRGPELGTVRTSKLRYQVPTNNAVI